MSVDVLQIALEHHRAGRLREAEARYRQLMAEQPDLPDAPHWLGVLLLQAGQPAEAAPLLERACAMKPDDAAFAYNLGQANLSLREMTQAIAAFEKASTIDGAHGPSWLALGTALLGRNDPNDSRAALAALQHAADAGLDTAELHRQLATAFLACDRLDEAASEARIAIAKEPNEPTAYYRLALALRRLGDEKGVRKNLLKCLEIEPKFAHGWYALGMLDFAATNVASAAALFRRAISANPEFKPAHEALALALQWLGRKDEAADVTRDADKPSEAPRRVSSVEELEKKITPDKSSLELHYALAALTNVLPPAHVPQAAVAGLFDKYADTFDEHLRGALNYQAPEHIARALGGGPLGDVLDIGCGTGICGELLRPRAKSMTGVDLSPGMVEKARNKNIYDHLEAAELVSYLRDHTRTFDTLVAGDVLLYLGDLSPTFEAAAGCARPGGRFAFTVEAGGGERYDLQVKTRRYRHSKPYIQKLAAMFGFTEEVFEAVALRTESLKPVAGWMVVLRAPVA